MHVQSNIVAALPKVRVSDFDTFQEGQKTFLSDYCTGISIQITQVNIISAVFDILV